MERIVGIIPVRFASTRLPGKAMIKLCGKEMIVRVYERVKMVPELSDVYVAIDDERIQNLCMKKGIKTIMTSSKCKSGTDRICEAISQIEADYVINIQGDEPLLEPENISRLVQFHKENLNIDVINVMTRIKKPEEKDENSVVKVAFNNNKDLIYLSRVAIPGQKNNNKIEYYKHCGIYGLTKSALHFFGKTQKGRLELIEDIEMLRFLENGFQIKVLEIETDSIGVDTQADAYLVEQKISYIEKEG